MEADDHEDHEHGEHLDLGLVPEDQLRLREPAGHGAGDTDRVILGGQLVGVALPERALIAERHVGPEEQVGQRRGPVLPRGREEPQRVRDRDGGGDPAERRDLASRHGQRAQDGVRLDVRRQSLGLSLYDDGAREQREAEPPRRFHLRVQRGRVGGDERP